LPCRVLCSLQDCKSHYWVKLEVDKIKGMLNF
jgi:hypothetical protein